MDSKGGVRIGLSVPARSRVTLRSLLTLVFLVGSVALFSLAPQSAAQAQETQQQAERELQDIQQQQQAAEARRAALEEQAEQARSAASQTARQLIRVGKRVSGLEQELVSLNDEISQLAQLQSEQQAQLSARQADVTALIAALQRIARRPPALALAAPEQTLATVRSAELMSTLLPDIRDQTEALKASLATMREIEDKLSTRRYRRREALARLSRQQEELKALVAIRRQEARTASAAATREGEAAVRLAARADSLEELIKTLAERAAEERARAAAAAAAAATRTSSGPPDGITAPPPGLTGAALARFKGQLTWPASGRIVRGFGQKDGAFASKGLRISAPEGGQVVAPFEGQILFAGRYRGYGQVLIIAHSGGYHTLLAGLGTLYATTGQWVLTAEPLGAMPAKKAGDDISLYVELRRQGKTLDPAPWLSRPVRLASGSAETGGDNAAGASD